MLAKIYRTYADTNLILEIVIGIILGILLGAFYAEGAASVSFLGELFVGALKAIAPILVFILVLTSICTRDFGQHGAQFRRVLVLYVIGMLLASVSAVLASSFFHLELVLNVTQAEATSPESIGAVFISLMKSIVANPIHALSNGNYLGILTWAIAFGVALKGCNHTSKEFFLDINTAVLKIVRFIVKLAPFGIFALVANSVAETGSGGLLSYGRLLLVLVATMLFVFFVINAAIVFCVTRKNPYPLIFICLKHSAIFAFFTRSSAANIPVNLELSQKLGIEEDLYSVSVPLGATVNMSGAAVTIAMLSLAAAHTVGIEVNFWQAFFLCVIATFGACGASGVAGGSLLLIPLACSLFQMDYDIAMQVVAVGFIIGVIQDSVETALNSSTDVLFTAACSKKELNLNI